MPLINPYALSWGFIGLKRKKQPYMSKILKQFSVNGKTYRLKDSFGKYSIYISDENVNIGMAKISQKGPTFKNKNEAIKQFLRIKENLLKKT